MTNKLKQNNKLIIINQLQLYESTKIRDEWYDLTYETNIPC